MKLTISLAFMAASAATICSAETVDALDLIAKCEIAAKYNGDVALAAIPLSQMSGLDLTPENQARGAECLRQNFGYQFNFDNTLSAFVADDADMEKTRPAREAAQREEDEKRAADDRLRTERERQEDLQKQERLRVEEQQRQEREQRRAEERRQQEALDEAQKQEEANKIELHRRINDACYDTLRTNELQAVLEPVCQNIFIVNGFKKN